MRNAFLASIVLGLIALSPVAALADRHGGGYSRGYSGYSHGGYSHGGGYYRGGGYDHGGDWDRGRSHSHFDFSLGLGFIFGAPRHYYDDSPRYYYADPPVVYREPVVVEEPAVVYCPPPPVYYTPAPVVVYQSYDAGYCYPRTYTYTQTRYYYGR